MGCPRPSATCRALRVTVLLKFAFFRADLVRNISVLKGHAMARGRTSSLTITLPPEQRQTLVAWQRSLTLPAGQVRRARMVLLRADGLSIADIARTVGGSRRLVYKWLRRFHRLGMAGLLELPRHGSRPGDPPP
jgi:hypothetical protein